MNTTTIDDLTAELTGILAAIARHSLERPDAIDVAGILAASFAAAAANEGGPEVLLAGRPDSWEAAHLRNLLLAALGDDPDRWLEVRYEAITITLNVAELIESGDLHPGLAGLEEVSAILDAEYDQKPDTDEAAREFLDASDELIDRYHGGYQRYAEQFAAAVAAIAADMHLPDPHVVADADPMAQWWTPGAVHNSPLWEDLLVDEIWERAHAIVPLPNVMIRARSERTAP